MPGEAGYIPRADSNQLSGRGLNAQQQRAAMIQAGDVRLAELTERLARLEALLDEVGIDRRRRQHGGRPWMQAPASPAMSVAMPHQLPGGPGRFIAVSPSPSPGRRGMPSSHTPPVPMPPTGAMSPGMPMGPLAWGAGMPPPMGPGSFGPPMGYPGPQPCAQSFTPGPMGQQTSFTPQLGQSSFTPPLVGPQGGPYATPRVGGAGSCGSVRGRSPRIGDRGSAFGGRPPGSSRACSAPRPGASPLPGRPGPQGFWPQAAPGGPKAPCSLAGSVSAGSPEDKIRRWLSGIPIGEGADRGWDEGQIADIADFARSHRLEDASAEEMYKRFVEWQVEKAERCGG